MPSLLALLTALARADEPAADPPEEADEGVMVVTAARTEQSREDVTAPIDVIGRERIEATGATTLDDVLRTVPGLQVTASHGGSGVSMQGLDPEHTLILVDGRPLAGRVEGTVDLRRIPVADIERIEILPGPAGALYGSEALGGVINVITKKDAGAPRADVTANFGSRSLSRTSGSLSGGTGKFSGGISGDHNAQDGWDGDKSDPATSGDDVLAWGGRAWGRFAPGAATSLEADADYHQRDTRGVQSAGAGALFDVRTLQETADGGLAFRWLTGARTTLRARASAAVWRQQYLQDQRGSDVQDNYEETFDRRTYGNLVWQWVPDGHLFAAGLDTTHETLTSARLDDGAASRTRVALYAQDDWKIVDSDVVFSASPGARVDIDSQFGVNVTPHLAVRFDPAKALSLRLTGGRGYRAPEFKELYLAFDHAAYGYVLRGNPDLHPESSLGATLDARWSFVPDRLQLQAQGWWNEVDGLINPKLVTEGSSSSSAQYAYGNVDHATTRGGQVGLSWVQRGPVTASVQYTFTDARSRADDTRLDGRAPHRLSGNAQVRPCKPLELAVNVEWSGPRPYTLNDVTTWSGAYAWVDARAAWTVRPGIVVEAGARNLLDARDDTYLGLAPRTLFAGVRANGTLQADEKK